MESNESSIVEQRVHQLRVEKQNIRKETDSLTQEWMRPATVHTKTAWERVKAGDESSTFETDAVKASIREKLEKLERRENLIDQAILGGTIELERLRAQDSLVDCAAQRPALVAEIKDLLLHLRGVEKANRRIGKIFEGIHGRGHTSGSLPPPQFDLGGRWNDRSGGRLVDHCKYLSKNYPEIEKLALSELDD
jgi:hypothetical protein